MELQWNSMPWTYLKSNVHQVMNQEQTLEVRLSDGMPDIGRVLCAWGQPVLRSKEWRNDGMSVTGGVTVWVLYMPEDGSAPQSIQAWLPFQGKWNFSDSRREGVIRTDCLLRSVDARTLSARKLMVRANVGIMGQALEQIQTDVYQPGELPEQVYALKRNYPVTLPVEAGEKLLNLEESMAPPAATERLLACQVRPVLSEQNVLAGRVLVRGTAFADMVCLDSDGRVFSQTMELPFAQYADLEREYDKDASVEVTMAVSNLEPELTENTIRVKCNLIAQYLVREQRMLSVVEDVYSPVRKVTPKMQELRLPTVLDSRTEWVDAVQEMDAPRAAPVNGVFLPDHPTVYREGVQATLELPGNFGLLYYDADGMLQAKTEPWSDTVRLPAGEQSRILTSITQTQSPVPMLQADGVRLNGQLRLEMTTMADLELPMVTALEVGEMLQPDPNRPSLLLQRMGEGGLWSLAKATGSTVDAILDANGLQGEPAPDQMLLIPVI